MTTLPSEIVRQFFDKVRSGLATGYSHSLHGRAGARSSNDRRKRNHRSPNTSQLC